jgi:hypothetical protein
LKSHTPLSQMPEQQSKGNTQPAPFGRQFPGPQTPAVQRLPQHWEAFWHKNPSGWQPLPQTFWLQSRLQHSLSEKQDAPCGLHMICPQ